MRQYAVRFYNLLLVVASAALMLLWNKEDLQAQNLVPNPSFEIFTMCPNASGPIGPMICPPWISVLGTADYYHTCSANLFSSAPVNVQGYQQPHTGQAYTGGHQFFGANYREYIQAPLLQTLQAGHCYQVGFYLNLGNISCGINFMGALLTPNAVANPLGMVPQLDAHETYFSDTSDWVFVFDYIVATGNEAYITIGNFHTNTETNFDPSCINPMLGYYFFEDVIVQEVMPENIDVELDGPVTVCDSFLIEPILNPNVTEVVYTWSDGSHKTTLTVYSSGEYTVTVHYGCSSDVASIDVQVFNPPAVDIGPDVILCPGDTYSISLDPSLGNYEWQDGSTDADYTISDAGQYHVVMDDGCDLTSDTIEVTILDPPLPFSLGNDTFLCPGEHISFHFDPALGNFEWEDGSHSPSYQIDDEGNYTLTISNMCGSVSDEIDVTEIPNPFFDIGPDTSHICQGENIHVSIDPTIGSVLWQDGSHNPDYTIQSSGTYSVTVTNVCGFETDLMVVGVTDPPLVLLGPDIQTCTGDTILLDVGTNTGQYQWQNGSTLPTLEVTVSGLYALSVTNSCGFDRDTISIAYLPDVLQPDLGPDLNLCPGEQAIFHVNSSSASVLWNDLSTLDSLIVDSAGIYYVQVANICNSFSDSILVTTSNAAPVLNLPADFPLCQGQTFILDANITGVNYQWNDLSTDSHLMVTAPGIYSLTVTNSCGSAIDSVTISDGGVAASVGLGIDTSICESSSILLSPISSNVLNWLWQDGSTDPTLLVSSPGEYHVTVSNACGENYDSITIGSLPAVPILSFGADTLICPGDELSIIINIPQVDILWFNSSTNPEVMVGGQTLVYASISNSCGTSSDTMIIGLLPGIPSLDLGPDQSICPGEVITIDPGIPDVLYQWQDGSTGPFLNVAQEGWITLMISNQCGMDSDSLLITESTDGPQLDLGPDIIACVGDTAIIPSNISGVNYIWQDGSDHNSFTATASGTYYLEVSNLCGMDSDTIQVDISGESPVTDLGADTSLCDGATLTLNAQTDPNTTAIWQDGSTSPFFLVQAPGIYSLYQANHCGQNSDSIYVTYIYPPQPFDLGQDTVLCEGEFLVLTVPDTTFEFQWQDGSILPEYLANTPGVYTLQLSNECGSQSDEIILDYDAQTPLVDLGPDSMICVGDKILLDVTQPSPAEYAWSTGQTSSSIEISAPGIYLVTVTTPCGNASDEIMITTNPSCGSTNGIYIPNIISPNGDNINDLFTIFPDDGLDIISIEGSIFDRWGNLIFNSTSYPFIWDGRFGKEDVIPGVYVYSIKLTYWLNNKVLQERRLGDLTIVQ